MLKVRASLFRADSTISKHSRSRAGGSTVNEELLRGLGLRDPPRAEVLSEALQGPPIQPPGAQLAALSQVRQASLSASSSNENRATQSGIIKTCLKQNIKLPSC